MNHCIDCVWFYKYKDDDYACNYSENQDPVDGSMGNCYDVRVHGPCSREGKFFQSRTHAETLEKVLAEAEKVAPTQHAVSAGDESPPVIVSRNETLVERAKAGEFDETAKPIWEVLGEIGRSAPEGTWDKHNEEQEATRQAAKDAVFGRRVAKRLGMARQPPGVVLDLFEFFQNTLDDYRQVYGE